MVAHYRLSGPLADLQSKVRKAIAITAARCRVPMAIGL
jgi:hypothetical protein